MEILCHDKRLAGKYQDWHSLSVGARGLIAECVIAGWLLVHYRAARRQKPLCTPWVTMTLSSVSILLPLQMAQGTESPSNQLILGPTNQFTSQQSWERPTGQRKSAVSGNTLLLEPDTTWYISSGYFGKLVQRCWPKAAGHHMGKQGWLNWHFLNIVHPPLLHLPSLQLEAFPVCQVLPSQVPQPLLIKSFWEPD